MISKWLSKMGSRFLFGIAVLACSFIFLPSENLAVGFIGFVLFLYGAYTAISVIDQIRCKYINQYTVLVGQEIEMQYLLIQAKYYAYAPIIAIFCPHFYISFKKEFYLVPVESPVAMQPNTKISKEIIGYNGAILLSDADYASLMRDANATLKKLVMK